jgi:DNA-binding NtrC family response regulator
VRRDHRGLLVRCSPRTATSARRCARSGSARTTTCPKPYDNDEIRALVARARELLALRAENARLREELATRYHDLVGDAPAMREVYRSSQRAAPTRATVLVTGESGTGQGARRARAARREPRAARASCA